MLKVVVWDVQHGSASFIKTPADKHIIIDLGTGSNKEMTFSPLLHLKNKYNIQRLDKAIITHPHRDHIDDIYELEKWYPRVLHRPRHLKEEDIRSGNKKEDQDKVSKYLEIDQIFTYPVSDDENPTLPRNNGGVTFHSFTPTRCNTNNINNHSIVTIVEYLNFKMMIPGDNQAESWEELLQSEAFRRAISGVDIMVASHHGRENGYYAPLFEYFKPLLVIISDGAETDTNASARYSKVARGWNVRHRSGTNEERFCITTRSDGVIVTEVWPGTDGTTYLQVTID